MTRVIVYLLLTCAAFGMVAFMAWHPELWRPLLGSYGIDQQGAILNAALKAAVTIVVGVPLTALIRAILRLGADRGRADIHGYAVIRLRAGARWFLLLGSLAGAALFFAMPILDPGSGMALAFQAAGVTVLVFGLVAVTAKIRYDNATLASYALFRGWRRHDWADLVGVEDVPALKSHVLRFRTGRKESISYRYAGLDDLIGLAQAKLDAHAGIAGSRNRQTRA